MKLSTKIAAVAAAAAASAGLAVGIAGTASASPNPGHPGPGPGPGSWNCAHGIYAGYCGTQKSGTGLYIAVGRHGQIVGTRHPQAMTGEFVWFADASRSAASNDKYAEFAPGGVASNLVMAEDGRHQVELAPASGAPNQKWVFDGKGWQNVATHDVLKATFDGGPVLAVHGPSFGPWETWTWMPA
jgi:hypothetical protein